MLKNSKRNFVSPRGHVIFSMYVYCGCTPRDKLALSLFWDKRKGTTNKSSPNLDVGPLRWVTYGYSAYYVHVVLGNELATGSF